MYRRRESKIGRVGREGGVRRRGWLRSHARGIISLLLVRSQKEERGLREGGGFGFFFGE